MPALPWPVSQQSGEVCQVIPAEELSDSSQLQKQRPAWQMRVPFPSLPTICLAERVFRKAERMWLWQLWIMQVPRRQIEVGFWSYLVVHSERRTTANPSLRHIHWFVLFGSLSVKLVLFIFMSGWAARPQHMDLVLEKEVETGIKKTFWWAGSLMSAEAMQERICILEGRL